MNVRRRFWHPDYKVFGSEAIAAFFLCSGWKCIWKQSVLGKPLCASTKITTCHDPDTPNHHHHHPAVCLTTGSKPPPKRSLHILRSSASSFKWQYPLLSLRSSSSFLRLLPCLLVTSISPFIFPSITCFRRQFLRKMWPIQLAFRFIIACTCTYI